MIPILSMPKPALINACGGWENTKADCWNLARGNSFGILTVWAASSTPLVTLGLDIKQLIMLWKNIETYYTRINRHFVLASPQFLKPRFLFRREIFDWRWCKQIHYLSKTAILIIISSQLSDWFFSPLQPMYKCLAYEVFQQMPANGNLNNWIMRLWYYSEKYNIYANFRLKVIDLTNMGATQSWAW